MITTPAAHTGNVRTGATARPAPAELAGVDAPPRRSALAGLGAYLPSHEITNRDLEAMVETSDEWILARTGIRSRRRAAREDATSDLAAVAARAAMADAGIGPADVDLLLVATATPDTPVPATSCRVQELLEMGETGAMDVGAGCSGFLYALHTADAFIRGGVHRTILVVGAECLTRVTDYTDRRTCILFGDGAGACVLTGRGPLELIHSHVGADGTQRDLIHIPAGGSRVPASSDTVAAGQHFLKLDGRRVFKHAVRRMAEAAQRAMAATGLTTDDFAAVIAHQANERIIRAVGEQLGLTDEQVVLDVAETGNTSAASVPIALTHARDARGFEPGRHVMLLAFGAGLTWAVQVLRVTGES